MKRTLKAGDLLYLTLDIDHTIFPDSPNKGDIACIHEILPRFVYGHLTQLISLHYVTGKCSGMKVRYDVAEYDADPTWDVTTLPWKNFPFRLVEEPMDNVEPKNNDGRDTCAWCGEPTRRVDSGFSWYNVCTRCGR